MINAILKRFEKPLERVLKEFTPLLQWPKYQILKMSNRRMEFKIFLGLLTKDLKKDYQIDLNKVICLTLDLTEQWFEKYGWNVESLAFVECQFDTNEAFIGSIKVTLYQPKEKPLWEQQNLFTVETDGKIFNSGNKQVGSINIQFKCLKSQAS